jgi:hypothetical protein
MPLILALALGLPACAVGPTSRDAPMRSPTVDYPDPAVTTADGQVLGVDGVPPEDKLRTSPRAGTGGLVPADMPASIERVRPHRATYGPPTIRSAACWALAPRSGSAAARCRTARASEGKLASVRKPLIMGAQQSWLAVRTRSVARGERRGSATWRLMTV